MAARPRDVPAAILAVATKLFATRGFDGTSLQDVADAIGVRKPSLLHHFPSKQILRQAVFDAMLAHWQRTLPRILVAATAPTDRFAAIFGELHRFFVEDPDRARLILREILDRPEAMRALVRGPMQPWIRAIAETIAQGRDRGEHPAGVDPEAYVLHVLQMVLIAVAAAPVAQAGLEGRAPKTRYDRELARIAEAALFAERPPPKKPKRERR
jgi:AcrR family transcriptional regulator